MEEMLDDTFESLEDDDLEDLADKEVEKVLYEVTAGNQMDVLVSLLHCSVQRRIKNGFFF